MYLHQIPVRLTVLAASLAAAVSVHAQQAQPAAPEADPKASPTEAAAKPVIQKVEVRGSADAYDPRRDDTASKTVVKHEEIIKYGDTTVLDVLKRLPGVTVIGSAIRMRGLGSGYTQILINGERAPAGFTIDTLAPDVIERIEVMRAASAEYSTQSIAGTINIVLKKIVQKPQHELKLGLGGADHMLQPSANLLLSDRVGQLSYSVSLNGIHSKQQNRSQSDEEGFDPAGRPTLLRTGSSISDNRFSALNLSPRLTWALENGDTLSAQSYINVSNYNGSYQSRTDTTLGMAAPYPNIDGANASQGKAVFSDVSLVHKFEGGAKIDTKFALNWNANRNQSHQLGYAQPGVYTLDRVVDSDGDEHGFSFTGKYTTPVVEGHALAAGWDTGASKRIEDRVQRDAQVMTVPDEDYAAKVTRLALYAQDEWNLTPRWSVYAGARWEGIDTRSSGSGFAAVGSRSSVFSPLFQTLWKLPNTKGDQLRMALTRTYKAPPTGRLIPRRFLSTDNTQVTPDSMGNPNLQPELALGLDASYEHYWGTGALVSVSGSMRRIDGYTRNGVIFDDTGRWVSLPLNNGRANTRGLELEAKFPLSAVMQNAPGLDLRASISRNWSSVDSVPGPDNRLDQQTPLSATLGLDYKAGALSTGGSFAFRNGGPVRISVNQTSYSNVRRDLEAYVLWKFDPKNQLRVAFNNLLRQDGIWNSSYTDASGSMHIGGTNPGHTSLRASMEMKF